ncbi:MAG: TlpA disulfide reductase family protein [Planctomycetota bacterium]
MKRLALILAACVAVAALTLQPAEAEPTLTIGSKAPSLDIEHWIQDGDGRYAHITDFESGKVYVVEFWATWCGPCIASMPHLAELQTRFRDSDVQIISISDESVDEIEAFLKRKNPEVGKSFAEITSAYSLTTDPDGSSHKDYMEAAQQNGIPTSFIVGKSGVVEWIGHPAELDEPLAAVTDGSWDREAFKEQLKEQEAFEQAIQGIAQLAGEGKTDEALTELDKQLEATKSKALKEQWVELRFRFRLMLGKVDESVVAHYQTELKNAKGTPYAVGQIGFMVYGAHQNGADVGTLAKDSIAAINTEIETADKDFLPILYNTVAQLHTVDKNFKDALAAQQKAVDMSDGRMKKRMELFLDELKGEIEGEGADAKASTEETSKE